MSFEYSMDKIVVAAMGEHARLYNFRVQISDFADIHEKMIISCGTPKLTVEGIPISWTSTSVEINGKGTFDPVTITFRENEDGAILKAFYEWHNKIIKMEGKEFTAEKYADIIKKIEVTQLDHAGADKFKYELWDAMPDGMPMITYSYEGSAIVQYDVNFKYLSYTIS